MNEGYSTQDCWDGVERRVGSQLAQFKSLLTDHTKDEMERYGEIIDKQDQLENKIINMDKRLGEMNANVLKFMESNSDFVKGVKRAFPRDEDGNPDFDGHSKAHLSWIRNAPEDKELMEFVRRQMKDEQKTAELLAYTKKVIFAGAAFAVVSFVSIATWAAFLRGPV